ncbi:MAG: GNAT family N-acetyltransferase, partial [Bdellovibrionota bacterium]
IEHQSAQVFPAEDLPEPLRSVPTSESVFREAQASGLLWVLIDPENLPVGFLLAEVIDENFHIKEMDVHPAHARKGLGGKLLEHSFTVARERNFSSITLTTFKHLPWNAPFYEKHGFVSLEESEMGAELSEILRQEAKDGLKNRIAMRRNITQTATKDNDTR